MGKTPTKKLIAAIKGSGAIMSTIAKRLDVHWNTADAHIAADPRAARALQNEEELILDIATGKLYEAVRQGDLAAIKYLLSTKGKKRGYTERQEVTGAGGQPIDLSVANLPNIPTETLMSFLHKRSGI